MNGFQSFYLKINMNLIFTLLIALLYVQQMPGNASDPAENADGIELSPFPLVNGIQCYQCSSEEDEFCPAFGKFDETKNALVDCFSLESYVPGHMCMKMVKESYDTFYGTVYSRLFSHETRSVSLIL